MADDLSAESIVAEELNDSLIAEALKTERQRLRRLGFNRCDWLMKRDGHDVLIIASIQVKRLTLPSSPEARTKTSTQ